MSKNPMIGMYFHTLRIEDGEVRFQGRVVAEVDSGNYLVQLFSAMDGHPTQMKLCAVEEMRCWNFYKDADQWREKFNESSNRLRTRK